MITALSKHPVWALSIAITAVVGTASVVAVHEHSAANSSKVLGEKITGTGSSSDGSAAGSTAKSVPAVRPTPGGGVGGGNGNGNSPGTPLGKTFSISGTVGDLYPGATNNLYLAVTNPNNQAIKVTDLSATLSSVSPSGCAATASNIVIHAYTGEQFPVAANGQAVSTGYIPIELPSTVANACQDAHFNLSYQGTAVQQ